jgi:hypothetical protein
MKSISKMLIAGAAFLITQSLYAQVKGVGHANVNAQARINARAAEHTAQASQNAAAHAAKASQKAARDAAKATREQARVNGSVNANAHANANAKNHANENSVLNGTGEVNTNGEVKVDDQDDKSNLNKHGAKRHVKGTKKTHTKRTDDDDKTKSE